MKKESKLNYLFIFLVLAGVFTFIYFAQLKISGFVPANGNANLPVKVQGEIILKDKQGLVIPAEFSIYDGQEKIKDRQSQGTMPPGKYRVVITPNSGPVKKIEIPDLTIDQDQNPIFYKDTSEDIASPVNKSWKETYALDMSSLDFSSATIQATAKGNSLFKCVEWDFETDTCNGKWKKILDIVPGQDYNFNLTPLDPGIGELNNTVNLLNKNNELLNYNEQVIDQNGKKNVNITPQSSAESYQEILIKEQNMNSNGKDLILYELNNSEYQEIKIIDGSNLDAVSVSATFKKNGALKDVLECNDLTLNDVCSGKWKKFLDISDESYTIIKTTPGKSAYGLSSDELLLLDKNFQLIPNDQQIIRKGDKDSDIGIQLSYIRPEKITTFYKKNNASQNELQVDYNETQETYSLKFSDLVTDYAEISASAKGNDLFECSTWDFDNQKCNGKFIKKIDLKKGENYNFSFNSTGLNISYAFKESKNRVALLDKNDYLYDYSESVISSYPDGSEDLEILFNEGNIKKIIVKKYDALSSENDLKVELNTSEKDFLQSFSIDPSLINMEEAQFTIAALGYAVMKCSNWNFTTQTCIDGNWTKLLDTIPGQDYILNVSASDPGFGELDESSAVQENFVNSGGSSSGGSSNGLSSINYLKNFSYEKKIIENKTSNESSNLPTNKLEISSIEVSRRNGFIDVEYSMANTAYEDKEFLLYFSILDSEENLKLEIEESQFIPENSEKYFNISIPIDEKLNKEKLFLVVDFEKFSSSKIDSVKIVPISGFSIINAEKNKNKLFSIIGLASLVFIFVLFGLYKIIRNRRKDNSLE